jgi:flavorubredoxin
MSNKELAKGIHWVGAIDWDVRDFHGYSTLAGTTYNAFLIIDEKITLIDTVKRSHYQDMMHQIREIIDPEKIDYLIINHVELDHAGALAEVMEAVKPEKLICSPMGKKAILEHFHRPDWPFEVVKTGEQLSIGQRTFYFLETRMLHWPDSMFTFATGLIRCSLLQRKTASSLLPMPLDSILPPANDSTIRYRFP